MLSMAGLPAAQPEQLRRYAKAVKDMAEKLANEEDCSVCGRGPHVDRCPVPALREAREHLEFMAQVPVPEMPNIRGAR